MPLMQRNLNRILKNGKTVVIALDHGVEHGPSDFSSQTIDPRKVAATISAYGDAFMAHKGVAAAIRPVLQCPLILKLTGRTNLAPNQIQAKVACIEDAKDLDAYAVAMTVYIGEEKEWMMLQQLGEIEYLCRKEGIPLVGFMYPRGPKIKDKYDPEVVSYAARVGFELGCNIIKTYYTGSSKTFEKVVDAAVNVPVLAAGGPKMGDDVQVLQMVRDVIDAGGAGVAIGRNVWQHKNPVAMIKAVRSIVHENADVKEALRFLKP